MLTTDERADLLEQAQDMVALALVYSQLNRELECNELDQFVAQVGREVCELVVRRVSERQEQLEAANEAA